ncbi:MAG TPA: hypothetical protein VLY65_00650 [Nitrososphaerales archaeon]|nr:hypothetical protein [Nitrososphaerales archaeon]
MKLLVKHELPRRLRSAQVYLEFLNASLYLSVDGSKASMMGSIGSQQGRPVAITDREYSNYRASHDVVKVVDEDEDRVVLKTVEGNEEEWIRPRWILNGVRRARETTD